jgi:hypothetical protein
MNLMRYSLATTVLLVLFHFVLGPQAGADAASKKALFEEIVIANSLEEADKKLVKTAAGFLVNFDVRIPTHEQDEKRRILSGTINLSEISKLRWEIFDKTFSEDEAKYLLTLAKGSFGPKLKTYNELSFNTVSEFIKAQMKKNYQTAIGLKYVENVPSPATDSDSTPEELFNVCVRSPGIENSEACQTVYKNFAMRFVQFPNPNWATKLVWSIYPDQKHACQELTGGVTPASAAPTGPAATQKK